jgi:hypothetical protein
MLNKAPPPLATLVLDSYNHELGLLFCINVTLLMTRKHSRRFLFRSLFSAFSSNTHSVGDKAKKSSFFADNSCDNKNWKELVFYIEFVTFSFGWIGRTQHLEVLSTTSSLTFSLFQVFILFPSDSQASNWFYQWKKKPKTLWDMIWHGIEHGLRSTVWFPFSDFYSYKCST